MKTIIFILICLVALFLFLVLMSTKDDYEAVHSEGKHKIEDHDESN